MMNLKHVIMHHEVYLDIENWLMYSFLELINLIRYYQYHHTCTHKYVHLELLAPFTAKNTTLLSIQAFENLKFNVKNIKIFGHNFLFKFSQKESMSGIFIQWV